MTEDWPDFGEVDWDDHYPRLLLVAIGKLRRVRWRGQACATAPMALQAEDFVQMAIQEALSGERQYDPSRSLFQNFCQIISSEISNVVSSYENRNVDHADDEKIVDMQDYKRDTPESAAIYNQMVERLLAYLAERDPPARQVAEQIIVYERVKSLELTVELKQPVSEIENIKKRLRRLCAKFRREHEQEPAPKIVTQNAPSGLT
jgi:DNA-directed RNA polymerase specialized sigma24 family protein